VPEEGDAGGGVAGVGLGVGVLGVGPVAGVEPAADVESAAGFASLSC
jgi:hypothetical protein